MPQRPYAPHSAARTGEPLIRKTVRTARRDLMLIAVIFVEDGSWNFGKNRCNFG